MKKNKNNQAYSGASDGVERARGLARQPGISPSPAAQTPCATTMMPQSGPYRVVGNGMPMGLPVYSSVDQYGRVFSPIMSYGPQPNSAPVPVATPASFVQLTPIVSPVSFVPYSTQNQPLFQFDEDATK